jgi:hypothetical protein
MIGEGGGPPWWGVPVIAGGFLVLGAVLGFVFNRINEDRKAKQTNFVRWDPELRKITRAVIRTARAALDSPLEIIQFQNGGYEISDSAYKEVEAKLDKHAAALKRHLNDFEIIAPEKAFDALGEIWGRTIILRGSIRAGRMPSSAKDASSDLNKSIWNFIDVMRDHFGVDPFKKTNVIDL